MRRLPTEGLILLLVIAAAAGLPWAWPAAPVEVGRLTIGGLAPGDSREDVMRVWKLPRVPDFGEVRRPKHFDVATIVDGRLIMVRGPVLESNGGPILSQGYIEAGLHCPTSPGDVRRVLGSCDRYEGGGFFSAEPRVMVYSRYDLRVRYDLKQMVNEYRLGPLTDGSF